MSGRWLSAFMATLFVLLCFAWLDAFEAARRPAASVSVNFKAEVRPVLDTPDLPCRARDPNGVVVRSRTRRDLFRRMTGYPNGRPGYVVDHIVPLACGGCDVPSNMTWQTVADGKAKDRWERDICGGGSGPEGDKP